MASSSHNHQNSATRGGVGSTPTPANSGLTGLFSSKANTHDPEMNQPSSQQAIDPKSQTTIAEGRRRSSQDGGGMYGNINRLKRNSNDMNAQARKTSMSEQTPQNGILGKMWSSFTQGGTTK